MHRVKLLFILMAVFFFMGAPLGPGQGCFSTDPDCSSDLPTWYVTVRILNRGKETVHLRREARGSGRGSDRLEVGQIYRSPMWSGYIDKREEFEERFTKYRMWRDGRELGFIYLFLTEEPDEGEHTVNITMTEPEFWVFRFSSDDPRVEARHSP